MPFLYPSRGRTPIPFHRDKDTWIIDFDFNRFPNLISVFTDFAGFNVSNRVSEITRRIIDSEIRKAIIVEPVFKGA